MSCLPTNQTAITDRTPTNDRSGKKPMTPITSKHKIYGIAAALGTGYGPAVVPIRHVAAELDLTSGNQLGYVLVYRPQIRPDAHRCLF